MELIKRTNLSEEVSRQLLSMIGSGRYKPGDRLPSEPELAKKMGVSRTAIREGIKALAGINMLSIVPGRGTFINEDPDILVGPQALGVALQGATLKNILEVRSILDAGIARYAALSATKRDLEAMRAALAMMESAMQSEPPDRKLATEGDESFHMALCAATHNKLLEKMAWPLVNHAMLRRWKLVRFDKPAIQTALDGHRDIYEAVRDKEPDKAVTAMIRHLEVGEEFYQSNKTGGLKEGVGE